MPNHHDVIAVFLCFLPNAINLYLSLEGFSIKAKRLINVFSYPFTRITCILSENCPNSIYGQTWCALIMAREATIAPNAVVFNTARYLTLQ